MFSCLLGVILAATPPIVLPQPPTLEVNCDAGQSLEKALLAVQKSPGATIRIRGTCVGNFVLGTDRIRLEGVTEERAVLRAPNSTDRSTVLTIKDALNVQVRRLRLQHGGQSGVGLMFERSPLGLVYNCEFDQSEVGLVFRGSDDGTVWDSSFHDNEDGLLSSSRSSVYVRRSSFRDNTDVGLLAFVNSDLTVVSSEVTGNGSGGAGAQFRSSLDLLDVVFRENDGVHVFATEHGAVHFVSGVTLGGSQDRTAWSAGLGASSTLTAGWRSTFYGDVYLLGDSFLELGELSVNGRIWATSFSRVSLGRTLVSKEAVCSQGADLSCVFGTRVSAFDCPSATACQRPITVEVPTDRIEPPEPPSILVQRVRPFLENLFPMRTPNEEE